MKVYLDTGVFVDYLVYRGHAGRYLRKRGRRNRTRRQLHKDVTDCLSKIGRKHDGFTSSLTLYEAEEALFSKLMKLSTRIQNRKRFVIISSRSLCIQILAVKSFYNLRIVNLSENVFQKCTRETQLQIRGIRAGDSLHMATATLNNADILITTDHHLLSLNNVFRNQKGNFIQCVDTDLAKNLL